MTRQTGIFLAAVGAGLALMAVLALATLMLTRVEVGSWQGIMSAATSALGIGLLVVGLIAIVRNKR